MTLLITEVLSNGQTSKSNTGTGTWGLVHLTEDQGDLGLAIKLNDTGLLHFMVEIVSFTGTLSDTSENRVTTVSLGNVVLYKQLIHEIAQLSNFRLMLILGVGFQMTYNQLLDEDSLTDTGTTEETNLTTTGIWGKKIDDLDTSDENLSRGGLLNELGGFSVDGGHLDTLDWAALVNWVTSDVHDTSEGTRADRNLDGKAGVSDLGTTNETFGTCSAEAC